MPTGNSSATTGEIIEFVKTFVKVSWPTTLSSIDLRESPKQICKPFSKLYPIESLILICGSQILNISGHDGAAPHAKTRYQRTNGTAQRASTHYQCKNGTAPPASLDADNSQHQSLTIVSNFQFIGTFIVAFFFPSLSPRPPEMAF